MKVKSTLHSSSSYQCDEMEHFKGGDTKVNKYILRNDNQYIYRLDVDIKG